MSGGWLDLGEPRLHQLGGALDDADRIRLAYPHLHVVHAKRGKLAGAA